VRVETKTNLAEEIKSGNGLSPKGLTIKKDSNVQNGCEDSPTHWIFQMSDKKFLSTRRAPASAPAGTLSVDEAVELSEKQARRPPAAVGPNRHCPLILLAENREPVRVALKKILDARGYDVIVVEQASAALSIAAAYGGHIDFFITQIEMGGMNGGLLAHLFQRRHPETCALILSGSREEVLICEGTLDHKVAVLAQPVGVDVVAGKLSEMIATRQAIQQKQ
jgi:CheY-like chemotaxis protein